MKRWRQRHRRPGNAAPALAVPVLGVAGVWTYRVFRADMRAIRSRLLEGSRVVSTAAGPVEVAEVGEGPPVLVVHGTAGGFDQGLALARDLVGEGYRHIAVSRFGSLRTPLPPDASSEAQADALACLLDALALPRVAVMGVSAGAHPAAALALRHPERVRALVLAVPALYAPPPPGAGGGPPAFITDVVLRSDFLVWLIVRVAPATMLQVAGVPRAVQRELSPQQRREALDGFSPASARHAGLVNDLRNVTPVAPDLPIEQLEMPVLLIGAEDDPYRSALVVRYSTTRIPAARAIVLERGGHELVGQQHRVRQEVRALLDRAATEQ